MQYHQSGRLKQEEEFFYNLGVAFHPLGRLDKATRAFMRAISICSNSAQTYKNLGFTLCSLGRRNHAVDAFQRTIATDPEDAGSYQTLGDTHRRRAKLCCAVTSYRRAFAINSNDAKLHLKLGNTYVRAVNIEEAIGSYPKALAVDPDLAAAHQNLRSTQNAIGRAYEEVDAANEVDKYPDKICGEFKMFKLKMPTMFYNKLEAIASSNNNADCLVRRVTKRERKKV